MQIVMCDKRDYKRGFGKGDAARPNQSLAPGNLARSPIDQRYERVQRLSYRKEWMLQKLCRIRPPFGINVDLGKVTKVVAER